MRKTILTITVITGFAMSCKAGDFTKYVNPMIGTGAVENSLSGNNHPAATVPYGMVQLGPDTHIAPDWYNASGYNYNDSTIYGFTHTRLSGTGASDLIDVSLFPTTTRTESSRFSHTIEIATPGYYGVRLADENIMAELTATPRVGIHRYTYPEAGNMNLWIDMERSANKASWNRTIINSQIRKVSDYAVAGYRIITGWAKLRKIYFYAEFSMPIKGLLMCSNGKEEASVDVANGTALKALLTFGTATATFRELTVKVGISAVSSENARQNLRAEAYNGTFGQYVAQADAEWDKCLGKIEVEGNEAQKTTFYTALYHTMLQPNVASDVNGEYTTAEYSTARVPGGSEQYTTFSLWDTYRAAHPLYTIIDTRRTADFVNSMLRHYDAYGYLPIWHLWGQDNYCMIGNHSVPVIADALLKGIPGIDAKKAFEAVKASLTTTHLNFPVKVWEKYGYMPENVQSQSVSITLEASYDDWCAAQIAQYVGNEADYKHFIARSRNFENLYNHKTHFFQPKDDKGEWIEPFDPLKYGANGGYPFTEGNAWQYYWYVPHDVKCLIELTGGNRMMEKKLDDFFTITDASGEKNDNISGMIGQYAHGNEPSHHVAYLYNYVGKPRKTQDMVHRIMTQLYDNTSAGYSGNDDCGEMSAWYVFGAMGFYPVNPADGTYQLGTPLFTRCTLHLENGKELKIVAKTANKTYYHVSQVKLNGKVQKGTTLKHSDIMNGGLLEFYMCK